MKRIKVSRTKTIQLRNDSFPFCDRLHLSTTVLSKFQWHLLVVLCLEIQTHMLENKVYTLTKAMEVESKKMHREVISMGKEVPTMQIDKEHDPRVRLLSSSKSLNSSQFLSGRYTSIVSY